MARLITSTMLVVSLIAFLVPARDLIAQTPAGDAPSADLIGPLAKELSATNQQAEGAAGALFALAKTRLVPDDFSKLSTAVPGMDQLLAAAPKAANPAMAVATSGLAGVAAQMGGLAGVAGAFTSLGLKPELIAKAVPILTSYVSKTGGSSLAGLLAGALK
jgi:uncharacterized protein VcgC/VcgE DUF2780